MVAFELARSALAPNLHARHLVDERHELRRGEMPARLLQPARNIAPNRFDPGLVFLLEDGRALGFLDRRFHARRGRWTVKVVPRSSDDSTSILPLCARTI